MKVITYARVSTEEQGDSQLSLEAQRATLQAWADQRSGADNIEAWEHVYDIASARDIARPGIERVLASIGCGDVLVVTKLDRLSRSVADFADLCERAQREGWAIIALDVGVDMTTPTGKMVANIVMSVAQWEREINSQRTRESLAEKRARGERVGGPVPKPITADAARLIRNMEPWFHGWEACARALNAGGHETPQGQPWTRAALYGWVMRNKRAVGHPGAEEAE